MNDDKLLDILTRDGIAIGLRAAARIRELKELLNDCERINEDQASRIREQRDLLDECEKALGAVFGEKRLDLERDKRWEFARGVFDKLRAQEKADETE